MTADGPVQIGPGIRAGFTGTCAFCNDGIKPGDIICSVDLTWAHEACVDREVGW